MNTLTSVIGILAAVYFFFIIAPGIAAFFAVFTRKSGRNFRETDVKKTYYAPYIDEMNAAYERVTARKPERMTITSFDKTELAADYYNSNSDTTVVLLHGYNTPPLNNFSVIADHFLSRGFNLLIPYARGHLCSGGKRSTLGLYERKDLIYWLDMLVREYVPKNIVIYGMSMGCATAAMASSSIGKDSRVKALILDCGYTSPYEQLKSDMKRRGLPWMLMLPFTNVMCVSKLHEDLRTSAVDALKKNRIPALFLHGKADGSVPFELGVKNYEACASEKEALFVEGADHTMCFTAGGKEVRDAVDAFIDRNI